MLIQGNSNDDSDSISSEFTDDIFRYQSPERLDSMEKRRGD